MDPFTLAFGVAGLATSLFGGMKTSSDAQQAAQISGQIAGVQQDQNQVRQNIMNVQARRSQLEIIRNTQRARAQATQAGVLQGAQYGSGMQGGIASVTDQGLFGLVGVNQQQAAGNQMFGYENQISGLKQQLATVQGQEATDQGIASLGGSIMKSAPMLGSLTQYGASGLGSSIFGAVNSGGMLFQ